jgi:hypothetical protein
LLADRKRQHFLDSETFLSTLDSLSLTEHLNDQELLTLMRRFKSDDNAASSEVNKIWYHEMADMLSFIYFTANRSSYKPFVSGGGGGGSAASVGLMHGTTAAATTIAGGGGNTRLVKDVSSLASFLKTARTRSVQWRR